MMASTGPILCDSRNSASAAIPNVLFRWAQEETADRAGRQKTKLPSRVALATNGETLTGISDEAVAEPSV